MFGKAMPERVKIIDYRDFYDVPRALVVQWSGRTFLFDCPFNDQLDDYADSYVVYELPEYSPWDLERAWPQPSEIVSRRIGTVPVNGVGFDSTKRLTIDGSVFEMLPLDIAA
jgi:hypothetical protein